VDGDAADLGPCIDTDELVGRYQLRGTLGAGAMGIVYEAWDPQLRRRVAVKLVRPERADPAAHARMLREAQTLARISHPNVVVVFDVGERDGEIYVATELVDGETMASWQAGKSRDEIVGAWIQAARGLAAAHAQGVVHRDVKPANVLVGRDGRVRIGDFGLARVGAEDAAMTGPTPDDASVTTTRSQATQTSVIAGTPAYMAPEQRRGKFDGRSDQFALCVALAEALTGVRPGSDSPVDVEPAALAAALRRGLREDPARRFATVDELADELAEAIAPPPPTPQRRSGILLGAGAGTLVLGVAVIATVARSRAAATCEVATVPSGLWPAWRRSTIEHRFSPGVATRIDGWLATWSAAAADVCTTDRGAPELRARRNRCLGDELASLEHQLAAWEGDPSEGLTLAQVALDQLPRIIRCSHGAIAAVAEPTEEQAARITTIRERLAVAQANANPAVAQAEIGQVVATARDIGYPPFTVEVLEQHAELQLERDPAEARASLREAVAVAEAGHDTLGQALSTIQLISAMSADDLAEAEQLAGTARALIAELGGDAGLEASLDRGLGNVYGSRRQFDDAITAYERARQELQRAVGPDSLDEAMILLALGAAHAGRDPDNARSQQAYADASAILARAGLTIPAAASRDPDALIRVTDELSVFSARLGPQSQVAFNAEVNYGIAYAAKDLPEASLAHYQRAAEIADRLGLHDVQVAEIHAQIASALIELGRARDALPSARRAAAVAEDLGVESELGYVLTILGWALVEVGDPAATAPLERSLAIRDRLHDPGQFRGNTRFLLARSLPGSARKRAIELAQAARVDIQAYVDSLVDDADPLAPSQRKRNQARLDQIDRWLLDHR